MTDRCGKYFKRSSCKLGNPQYAILHKSLVETPVESDSTATDETDTTVDYELSSYGTNMTEVQKLISANGVQPVWLDDIRAEVCRISKWWCQLQDLD